MSNSLRGNTTLFLIVALALILGIVMYALVLKQNQPETQPASTEPTSSPNSENSITTSDQYADNTVTIAKITLAQDGWIVIYDEKSGKPNTIIAAARLNAGTYTDRAVDLLGKTTQEGKTYFAVIHSDNGDRQFNYVDDLPIKDSSGNLISASFSATAANANDTADWKTYRNDKHGFEFRYPQNFSGTTDNDYSASFGSSRGSIIVNILERKFDPSNIIGIFGKVDNAKRVIIGNKQGYQFGEADAGCAGVATQTSIENKTLRVFISSCENDKNPIAHNQNEIDAILSTFKFTK